MRQLDMFGIDEARPRPACTIPEFTAYPDSLLRRLMATLQMLQNADHLPWSPDETKSQSVLFLNSINRLPPHRRGTLADAFTAELQRLSYNVRDLTVAARGDP